MKRLTSLLGVIACLASVSASAADQILTFTGLGPVRIGMTLAQAQKALGTKLKSVYPDMPKSCWFGNRADGIDGPVSYWIENGKIVRIDIEEYAWPNPEPVVPTVVTERGIRIGSTADEVRQAYGRELDVHHHPQGNLGDDSNLFMRVLGANKKNGLSFEIWEGKVKSFDAGIARVFYIDEPCT